MTANCPSCSSSHTRVIESRVLYNGARRRRYHCHSCAHRWTAWNGDRPLPGRRPAARGGNGGNKPPLTEDQVRLVLTSDLSAVKLARQLGRSSEAIAAIRRGTLHQYTLPEIPRWPARRRTLSCHGCNHWRDGRCGMGFPDPIDDGPGFAEDCAVYQPRTGTSGV